MHVSAKKIAVAGLLAAFTVVMLILSSTIETSSLFFIAAASFCVGIAIREWGVGFGFGFLAASVVLNFLLAPNKLYCITFAGMGIYLVLSEWLWEKIASMEAMNGRVMKLWIGKYVIFNLIYIPVLCFIPSLIFTKEVTGVLAVVFWGAGQIALWVYDKAYLYFQGCIWGKLRGKLL
ncbi:MAG: hypothetical protein IJZ53_06960 [Tyzzerella sp.]|nr:hypothetical protein [Tyzzerella sp.]